MNSDEDNKWWNALPGVAALVLLGGGFVFAFIKAAVESTLLGALVGLGYLGVVFIALAYFSWLEWKKWLHAKELPARVIAYRRRLIESGLYSPDYILSLDDDDDGSGGVPGW